MAFSILGSLVAFTLPLLIVGTTRPENAGRVLAMGARIYPHYRVYRLAL